MDIEDMQFYLHNLKKENLDLRNENQMQKVKIRKLTEDIHRMGKQFEAILDPRKNSNLTKILSRNGALLITKLKDENLTLYKKLSDKELQLKKLQSELETAKLYVSDKARVMSPSLKLLEQQELINKIASISQDKQFPLYTNKPRNKRSKSVAIGHRARSRSPSIIVDSGNEVQDEKAYAQLLNDNLQKIKKSSGMVGDKGCCPLNSSVMYNKTDIPHEEIQQLQTYLLNVLTEVDSLKSTINELQREQITKAMITEAEDQNFDNMENPQEIEKTSEIQQTEGYDTELTETVSKYSSKCSTCLSSGESDDNETTESEMKGFNKGTSCVKSISIQTSRSFCCSSLAPCNEDVIMEQNENIEMDDYDLEVEYLN